MFPTSTQKKFWTFSGTTELQRLRQDANERYLKQSNVTNGLNLDEEIVVRQHYEWMLVDFCKKFLPPMPRYVIGTAMAYFKRFYLHSSVMDYNPEHMHLACIYLASKVEEFNISIFQFLDNLKRRGVSDVEKRGASVLWHEAELVGHLRFQLTVHNPYRPFEGFLIDIKTRCREIRDPEVLRPVAEEFLDRCLQTDVCLIFSPSQIALAALMSSASRNDANLERYVFEHVVGKSDDSTLMLITEPLKRIRHMARGVRPVNPALLPPVFSKLAKCRNEYHEPGSEKFQAMLEEGYEAEDVRKAARRQQYEDEVAAFERDFMQR